MTEIRAVCFDAFGTLVEITDKRRPFRTLLQGGVGSITADELLTQRSRGCSQSRGTVTPRACRAHQYGSRASQWRTGCR
jgi:hypothetical protein